MDPRRAAREREKARLRRRRARVRKICNPWLVRGRESCRLVLLLLPLRLIQPTHPPHSFFYSPPTDNRARRGEEAPLPPPRRRRGRRHGDEAERDLGGVLLGVVEVLAVVPEPGLVDRAVDGHAARPGCATTWFVLISWSAYLDFVGLDFPTLRTSVGTSGLVVACPGGGGCWARSRLTSSVRDDLERGRGDLVLAACICVEVLAYGGRHCGG